MVDTTIEGNNEQTTQELAETDENRTKDDMDMLTRINNRDNQD